MAVGNNVKKKSHLKDIFLVLSKTFCVLILIMRSLFWLKNQKNALQKEIKDNKPIIDWGNQFLTPAD